LLDKVFSPLECVIYLAHPLMLTPLKGDDMFTIFDKNNPQLRVIDIL